MQPESKNKDAASGKSEKRLLEFGAQCFETFRRYRPLRTVLGGSTRSLLMRIFLTLTLAVILFENLLEAALAGIVKLPWLMSSSVVAIFAFAAISIAIVRVSRRIGDDIDSARMELQYAVDALRSSEAKFRTLSEQALVGTYILQEGRVVYVNPKCAEIFGYTREEVLEKQVETFVTDQDREVVRRYIEMRLMGNEQFSHFTVHGLRKDGTVIEAEVFGSSTEYLGRPAIIGTLLDVTEHRRTERTVQESEKKYRNLVDHSLVGIFKTNLKGEILYANEALSRMLGYGSPDELMRELITDTYKRKEDRERLLKALQEHGSVSGFELEQQTKSGETIHVLLNAVLEGHELSGMVLDITDRKRAEERRNRAETAIREANDRLKAVLESVNALVYVADMQTYEILFMNKYGRDVFGDIIGKICYEALQSGQSSPCKFCTNDRLVTSSGGPGEVLTWEFQNTRNGRWYHIHDRAIRWTDGRVVRLEIASDMTDRKQTEQMLFETERRFREILENVQLAAVCLDVRGAITFCNEFLLKLAGFDRKELLGKNWFDTFVPRDHELIHIFYRTIMTGTVPLHFECPIVTKQGVQRIVSWNHTILRNHEGTVIGVACIGEDITERRNLEARLLHAQKMESIGTLAGGIAHDFNNILTAITGFGNMLYRKIPDDDPLRFYVEQIMDASESAANLTRSLLVFGRKQVMSPKPHDLNEVVQKQKTILERIMGEDIEFTTVLEESELRVMLDFVQMEQVMMNLVANARDAMPGGGSLTVSTRRTSLGKDFVKTHGYGKPGEYALLSVSDNGAGMSKEVLERIFEPFFTTKEPYKGTGLGLSIVYGTVKQHDGYITVESRSGSGTTINIYLPLIAGTSEKSSSGTKRNEAGPGSRGMETILVAEDNEMIRDLIVRVLEESGYTVVSSPDGEAAIEKFTEHVDSIDLVIVDVVMPKKSGWEVYENIMSIRPASKVLFLSGYNSEILDQAGFKEKKVNFIAKPVTPPDLLKKVRDLLDEKSSRRRHSEPYRSKNDFL